MLISELIKTLQEKEKAYWDTEIKLMSNDWFELNKKDLDYIEHNWENWLFIYFYK